MHIGSKIPFDDQEKLQNYFLKETIRTNKGDHPLRSAFFGSKIGFGLVRLLDKCGILRSKFVQEKIIGISKKTLLNLVIAGASQYPTNKIAIMEAYSSICRKKFGSLVEDLKNSAAEKNISLVIVASKEDIDKNALYGFRTTLLSVIKKKIGSFLCAEISKIYNICIG